MLIALLPRNRARLLSLGQETVLQLGAGRPRKSGPHPRSRGSLSSSVFTFQGGGSQGLGGRGCVCKMNACGLQPPDLRWLVTAATGDSCGWGAERRGSLGSSF